MWQLNGALRALKGTAGACGRLQTIDVFSVPHTTAKLGVGCTDLPVPGLGEVWECSAVFYCDGSPYTITPARACAPSEDEAYSRWQDRLDDLTAPAQCSAKSFDSTCWDTGQGCSS